MDINNPEKELLEIITKRLEALSFSHETTTALELLKKSLLNDLEDN